MRQRVFLRTGDQHMFAAIARFPGRTVHRSCAAAAALLALVACADRNTDRAVIYELVRSGTAPLPVVLGTEGGCLNVLRGGRVVFPGDSTFTSSFHVEVLCEDSVPKAGPPIGTSGRAFVQNDTVFFTNALDQPAGFGVLTSDSLVVQGTGRRLVYHRERQ